MTAVEMLLRTSLVAVPAFMRVLPGEDLRAGGELDGERGGLGHAGGFGAAAGAGECDGERALLGGVGHGAEDPGGAAAGGRCRGQCRVP